MKLPAVLLAVGLAIAGCRHADPADVATLHDEIELLGEIGRSSEERTPVRLRAITAAVTSAHRRLDTIAGVHSW